MHQTYKSEQPSRCCVLSMLMSDQSSSSGEPRNTTTTAATPTTKRHGQKEKKKKQKGKRTALATTTRAKLQREYKRAGNRRKKEEKQTCRRAEQRRRRRRERRTDFQFPSLLPSFPMSFALSLLQKTRRYTRPNQSNTDSTRGPHNTSTSVCSPPYSNIAPPKKLRFTQQQPRRPAQVYTQPSSQR